MSEVILNSQILADLSFLKEKNLKIEIQISELNDELHEFRPDYLTKLETIDKGRFMVFHYNMAC
jgi:hypothetical protein